MVQLQKPAYAFMNGKITPWEEATVHVWSEALIRGISVFEGLKGYWSQDNSSFSLIALREHYGRLCRSARLQYLPFEMSFEQYRDACAELLKLLLENDRDMWVRTTLISKEGNWGLDTISDHVIAAFHQPKERPAPVRLGCSAWQRPNDACMPARIKSAANYQVSRMARIEARRCNFDDMIMLNAFGRVAEASGSALLIVRNGEVITPPATEGCLESITVDLIERICGKLSIPFVRRPVDRSELMIADEACLAGTLMEMGTVASVDGVALPEAHPVIDAIADEYWAAARRERTVPGLELEQILG